MAESAKQSAKQAKTPGESAKSTGGLTSQQQVVADLKRAAAMSDDDVKQEASRGTKSNQEIQENQEIQDESGSIQERQRDTASRVATGVASLTRRQVLEKCFRDKTPSPLSLADHIAGCIEIETDAAELIEADFRVLWHFTRAAKTHPELRNLKATEALKRIEQVMVRWPVKNDGPPKSSISTRAALRWTEYFGVDTEDARANFLTQWDSIRNLPNETPLDQAIARADATPVNFGSENEFLAIDTPGYRRFLTICGWLQVVNGDNPIAIPCELFAAKLNVKAMTVSRYREWGIADGMLRKTADHIFRPRKGERRRAAEFRFDVSRVKILEEASQRGTARSFSKTNRTSNHAPKGDE